MSAPVHVRTPDVTVGEGEGKRSTAGLAMFGLLLLSYALMAADRYLFPVLAADIRRAFGFALSNTGLLSTIFTLGIAIAGLPTGFLLTRHPRKAVLLIGIFIFSGATALTTVAGGFFSMLICLAAQGIGMSMLTTCMFALAANYFASNRAAAVGSVNVCYGLGGFLGPLITGILLTSYGTWHAPMLSFGLLLCEPIAGRGLSREDIRPGHSGLTAIPDQRQVLVNNVHRVEQLPLVGMDTFHLNIEEGIGSTFSWVVRWIFASLSLFKRLTLSNSA